MDRTQGPTPGQGTRPPSRFLRLLGPPEPPKPKVRRPKPPLFTEAQERWIRSAIRNAKPSFATWRCLADALHIDVHALRHALRGRNRISPELVIRFAGATGTSLDALLHPSIEAAGRCPSCGRSREGLQ